jgi:hypothetical protein
MANTALESDAGRPAHGPSRRTQPPVQGAAAAGRVNRQEHLVVELPRLGEVHLPQPQDLAYYAGVGLLVAFELLDWPAALALGIGHALLNRHHSRALQEFGEALEEA